MGQAISPDVRITIATDKALLRRAFEFRYRIYVEEMSRVQHYADHERRQIVDPLDDAGYNLVAMKGEQVVGVGRLNFAKDGALGSYEDLYGMADMGTDHPFRTSISTRLMIAPEYRGTLLALRIAMVAYALGLKRRTRWNFLDCNDHLVPFFTGLGYVSHHGPITHSEYGIVNGLVLELENVKHLNAVRSPLARIHRDHTIARSQGDVPGPVETFRAALLPLSR